MERKLVSKKLLSYAEAKKLVEERIKEGNYNETTERSWEYLKLFGTGDPELARRTIERLVNDLKLDEIIAVNIVNICPKEPGEVRLILAISKEFIYDEELVKKVLEYVQEYCGTLADQTE